MKIATLSLLLASASAIKLHQKAAMKKHITELRCPTAEEEAEIEAAIRGEFDEAGNGSVTKEEAAAWMESKGVTVSDEVAAELEAMFDEVDTSGNGELEADELLAAAGEYRKHCPAPAFVQLKAKHECPSADEEAEVAEALEGEFDAEGKGSITKDEVAGFLEAKGITPTEEEAAELEAVFDMIDTSGNGELELGELEAAFTEYRKHCPKPAPGFAQLKAKHECPSADEEAEVAAALEGEFDAEGKGSVTKDEVAGFLEAKGITPTEEEAAELEAVFDMIDTSGNGELELGELEAAFTEYRKHCPAPALLQTKKHIDKLRCPTPEEEAAIGEAIASQFDEEGNGSITKEEAAAWMEAQGVTVSDEVAGELEAIFDGIDTSGNGELEAEELLAAEGEYRKHCPAPSLLQIKSFRAKTPAAF